jgi:hypothetical protein
MVKSGYAKGANSGHVTQERTLKPKPARRKGVRYQFLQACIVRCFRTSRHIFAVGVK